MSLDSDVALLANVPIFASFEREPLRLLAFGAETRRLSAGARLFRQGAYSEGAYVIAEGTVELRDGGDDGPVVERVGPGTMLAEMALLTATDHPVSAIAPDGGSVLRIPRPLFRRMLEEYPDLAEQLHDEISERVQTFVGQLDRLRDRMDRYDGVERA